MSAKWLAEHRDGLRSGVIPVPREIDREVAEVKLRAMGVEIDRLTDEQSAYLGL